MSVDALFPPCRISKASPRRPGALMASSTGQTPSHYLCVQPASTSRSMPCEQHGSLLSWRKDLWPDTTWHQMPAARLTAEVNLGNHCTVQNLNASPCEEEHSNTQGRCPCHLHHLGSTDIQCPFASFQASLFENRRQVAFS